MKSLAILGLGGRGDMFARIALEENIKIKAVCDIDPVRRAIATELYVLNAKEVYGSAEDFFAAGKLADIVIIATLDETHYEFTLKALDLEYDVLLEKPIALSLHDVVGINEYAKLRNRKVGVCHVLRYAALYRKMKEIIDSGKIGRLMNINQTENVGYYHFAHSFVRGNWHNSIETCPSILAKCCHDLDLIVWLAGAECVSVSSFGELTYFKEENAPEGATERCKDCPHKDTCVYSGYNIYKAYPGMVKQPPYKEYTVENAYEVLADNATFYDKCVYKMDNDVCDHQMVNMQLTNGVLANLTLNAFSSEIYRRTQVCGTYGEINCLLDSGEMTVSVFGKEPETIRITINDNVSHHVGSDRALLVDFVNYVDGKQKSVGLTSLDKSIESHVIAFAAEESRLSGGKPVKIEKTR